MVFSMKIKHYYELTKSGLVFGNLITVIAGFLLGSAVVDRQGGVGGASFDLWRLVATLVGISLVMASGCVFNNYIDRDIDPLMERTRHRVLVEKKISGRGAIIFAAALGIAGFVLLAVFTNLLTVLVALLGFLFYVFMYSLWWKRRSVYGTFVGAISGATPPVVGYAAASGRLDMAALILFLIMLIWQMPHFFAIAIRRKDDYAAAHVPVMPVKNGIARTKVSMLVYIIEFIGAASLLTVFGYAGYGYLSIAIVLGAAWLVLCVKGFRIADVTANKKWARQMFFFSLIVMMVLFVTIAVGAITK
jgi:heme o synthase